MKRFKIAVEDVFPYKEMKEVLAYLESKGYEITLVDNGNFVCELVEVIEHD